MATQLELKGQGTSSREFIGPITAQEAFNIAEEICKKRTMFKDNSDSIPAEKPAYSTPDESILVETEYGVSFCNEDSTIAPLVEEVLTRLGHI